MWLAAPGPGRQGGGTRTGCVRRSGWTSSCRRRDERTEDRRANRPPPPGPRPAPRWTPPSHNTWCLRHRELKEQFNNSRASIQLYSLLINLQTIFSVNQWITWSMKALPRVLVGVFKCLVLYNILKILKHPYIGAAAITQFWTFLIWKEAISCQNSQLIFRLIVAALVEGKLWCCIVYKCCLFV